MLPSPYEQGQPLNPFPQCLECLKGLAHTAAKMSAHGDEDLADRAARAASLVLESPQARALTSPEIANLMLREIRQITKVADPYQETIAQEIKVARQAAERAGELMGGDLQSLAGLAALGNSLDFFKPTDEAMADVEALAASGVDFTHNDIPRLERALSKQPASVLFLSDNTGEIFFDLKLFDYVQQRVGQLTLVVKGGPALNDLTRAGLEATGLSGNFEHLADTGVAGAGVDWGRVSPEFVELAKGADLIITKGMANFETVCTRPIPTPVFCIFRVKCVPIQDYLGAPAESFWALWREPDESCRR